MYVYIDIKMALILIWRRLGQLANVRFVSLANHTRVCKRHDSARESSLSECLQGWYFHDHSSKNSRIFPKIGGDNNQHTRYNRANFYNYWTIFLFLIFYDIRKTLLAKTGVRSKWRIVYIERFVTKFNEDIYK